MLEDHSSYRIYLACFSKYFKKSADNAFGGIFHRIPTSTLMVQSGEIYTDFLENGIIQLGNAHHI